jgi:hypothetical protein
MFAPMNKLTVREHVKAFATLLRNKKVVYVDDSVVRRAAASLEGCAELLIDAEEEMEVPVMLTVKELRHFVSYMRALDAVAATTRESTQRLTVAELQANQLRLERDDLFDRLKLAERHLKDNHEFKESAKAAADRRKASGDGAGVGGGAEAPISRNFVRDLARQGRKRIRGSSRA